MNLEALEREIATKSAAAAALLRSQIDATIADNDRDRTLEEIAAVDVLFEEVARLRRQLAVSRRKP